MAHGRNQPVPQDGVGEPRRAVGYARQSLSRDDADSLSIEFQQREIAAYVGRQGWSLVGEFSDPDQKGWRRYRPGFDAMLDLVKQGGADCVVLYKLSRFARDLMMQEAVVTEIAEAGGELVSVTEPHISTSPMVRQILGAVNEAYRRDQSDWLRSTFAARARRGLHHGFAPIGYRLDDKRLVIDEQTGPIIREAWEWALAGHGTPEITWRLNERGLSTLRGKTWSPIAVLGVLRNPTYAGHVTHRGEIVARDAHPALVTQAEWETVQQLIDRRSYQRRKAAPSWTEGFVYHACGERMFMTGSYQDGVQRPRFRCKDSFAWRVRGVKPCTHRPASMYASFVEERIVQSLAGLADRLDHPERIMARIDAEHGATVRQMERTRAAIQRRLDGLRQQRDRLLDLVLEARIDADVYADRDTKLKADIAAVTSDLDALPPVVTLDDVRRTHEHLTTILANVLTVAHRHPDALPALLTALDARFVIGDGPARLEVGTRVAPYFRAPS